MRETIKSVLKQMITDFHGRSVPVPTPRELDLPTTKLRKAIVFIGMRRSGKTWAMYQHIQVLLKKGTPLQKMLYLNFEDDRLEGLTAKDLPTLLESYFELYPHYQDDKDLHFFLDEIHEVPGWEKFIRRLLDTENIALYLSGSSAKMLSKEIATALRGRTITREIFPFSFHEYLQHMHVATPSRMTSQQKRTLFHHCEKYLRWGGFPETIGAAEPLHRELLQGYVDTVIYRDIIERYQVTNALVLRKILHYCLQNPATLMSVNKMFGILKSQGHATSKNSLYEYMTHYEDAYCVFSVPLYDLSIKRVMLNAKKIYPVDPGLITAYTTKDSFMEAARLETIVFIALRRQVKDIHYYKTELSQEVDFLTVTPQQKMNLYQACLSLAHSETRDREITALQQAMKELHLKTGTIITLHEEDIIKVPEGTIECIPLWKFLLGLKGAFSSNFE